jgi:hypothetical protein
VITVAVRWYLRYSLSYRDLDANGTSSGSGWDRSGGEGAKQWMSMLTELRNRGVAGVCVV